ncbi:MAG: FlgD immunoglobulin-like domain containing protein [bacterium]
MASKNCSLKVKYTLLKIFTISSFLCVSLNNSYAAADAGTYAPMLTYWGNSARTLGMAGAFSGVADDAGAGYFNPAGLVQLNTQELTMMHSIVFAGTGTSMEMLTYGRPTSATSGFAATVMHFYTGGMNQAGVGGDATFSNREVAVLLTYAMRFVGPVWIGLNGKVYSHQMSAMNGLGYGADLGLFAFPEKTVSFGLAVQNAWKPKITLAEEACEFPVTTRFGLSVKAFRGLIIGAELVWPEYRSPTFGFGMEYRPIQMFYLRTGINSGALAAGVGLWHDMKRFEIRLDYAWMLPYQTGGMYGAGHNISLNLAFGGYRAKALCPTVAFSPTSPSEGKNVVWIYFDINPRTKVEKWQVLIKDEAGTVVRKIGAWGEPPYRVSWDGKDDNALIVPDGRYYYQLTVIEQGGRKWGYEGFLSAMYTVGPAGTVVIKSKGESPDYIQEERRQKSSVPGKQRGKTYKR